MTYREKAIGLIMDRLGVEDCYQAEEIIDLLEVQGEFKPCILGELNAPEDIEDWGTLIS